MVLCLIPSVGMLFFPTTKTSENKRMAPPPKLTAEDGSFNKSFFQDFESYFTEHVALRNQMVYTDALIQTSLFGESNVSGVICGTDGWLYYASTLSDYLGSNVMSDRQLYNLANNFSVIAEYVKSKGKDFVLTIAPNKNTLYGENMPYYKSYVVNSDHSAVLLEPLLRQQGVRYLDLFQLFQEQDEVLYLKRDSHWNNKGAALVSNAILDALGLAHEDYFGMTPALVKNENGDLNKMLYSFYAEPEDDYDYGLTHKYVYANNATDVEAGWIITDNPGGSGTLLMFRDSFANTLIPFLSNTFATAYYSKGEPNALEFYLETYSPDCVVIEKAERNMANYLNDPPVLTAPQTQLPENPAVAQTRSTVAWENFVNNANYYVIRGTLDESWIKTDSQILVRVNDRVYRAYQTAENGYLLYLKKAELSAAEAKISVFAASADQCVQMVSSQVQAPA